MSTRIVWLSESEGVRQSQAFESYLSLIRDQTRFTTYRLLAFFSSFVSRPNEVDHRQVLLY